MTTQTFRQTVRAAVIVCTTALAARAQSPAAIEHHLRFGVRLTGQPDTALEIADRMRSYHVPAVSIAIIDNYKVVFARAFGVKRFGGTEPIDTTTLFLAGSISKPIFASGFLRLVEDKRLSLDTNVNAYLASLHLPDSRFTETNKVTLRRLLTHTAGLTVWGFPGYDVDSTVPTVPQLLDGARPANTPAVRNDTFPGARWLYSGGGITIAQLVATDVSKESFPSLMRRLMLEPAGMKRSTYENPLPVSRRNENAWGHEQLDTPVHDGFHIYPEMAAAGLWTTPSDLARWPIALSHSYRDERGGVLSAAMAKQMVSKQVHQQPPYGNGFWGLGVSVGGDGDSLFFAHNGRDEGFVADMLMYPNRGRGYVIMMNGVNGGLMTEIERAIAEEYGLPAAPRIERKALALGPEKLRDYQGTYIGVSGKDTTRLDISVSPNGWLSVYQAPAKRSIPIAPVGDNAFVGLEGGGLWTFVRSSDGSAVKSLALGAGPNRRELMKQ